MSVTIRMSAVESPRGTTGANLSVPSNARLKFIRVSKMPGIAWNSPARNSLAWHKIT
jgi:hypothetical protein